VLFRLSKRRQYATGFKWGKIEHNAEARATKMLMLTTGILGIYILTWLSFLVYAALGLLIVTLGFRLIASVAHGREKHFMDVLRFSRKG
jgi:hypothetical protein